MKIISKKQEVVDLKTGEVLTVVTLIPETTKDKNFTKVFNLLSEKVIQDLQRLDGAVWLLFYIMKELKINSNEIYLNPEILSKTLRKTPRMIRIYIQKLKNLKYIFPVKGKKHFYTIDPHMVFKGQVSKFWNLNKSEMSVNQ